MNTKTPMFMLTLMLTTILVIITTNTMFAWMMMELNMLTFIPLICLQKSITETDTSIKYLIPQSFASTLFMISIIMTSLGFYTNILATTSLLMKMGGAPLHTWLPMVMYSINLMAGFMLLTWQKIVPLFLLSIPQLSFAPMVLASAVMSALWGSIAGLNQTNVMSMLTFSSISHLSWLTLAILLSLKMLCLYLMSYALTLLPIFVTMHMANMKMHKTMMWSSMEKYRMAVLILNLLSLAGFPPLAMFTNKMIIIMALTGEMTTILVPILIGTAIGLFFYMTFTFTAMFDLAKSLKLSSKITVLKPFFILSAVFQLFLLPMSFFLMVY